MSKINIEDNPKLRSPARRIVEWGFTTFMWALWLYLFLPLVTMVEVLLGRLRIPTPFRSRIAAAIGRIGGQAFVEGVQEGG